MGQSMLVLSPMGCPAASRERCQSGRHASMRFHVASETSRPSKYDDVAGDAAAAVGTAFPAGTAHALAVNSRTTRCGVEVDNLIVFSQLDFARTYKLDRCRRCIGKVGELSAWMKGEPLYDESYQGIGRTASYDWCRFRRMSHCWKSEELNVGACHEVGYAVWIPKDQGHCPRPKWTSQEQCPIGAPGPNTAGGFTNASVAWEDGGQRGGVPSAMYSVDEIARWHDGQKEFDDTTLSCGDAREAASQTETTDQVPAPREVIAQLERLAELRRTGAISEVEFQAMKSRVLRGR